MSHDKHDLTSDDERLIGEIRNAYRPYRLSSPALRRRRPVGRWLAGVAVVTAAVVIGAIVLRPPSALASWTRVPTSSERQALADATQDACRDQAATLIGVGEQADWPDDPGMEQMSRLPLVAHDQRGQASAALFADRERGAVAICVIVPVAGQPAYVELTAGTGTIPDDLGSVSVWMAAGGSNWDYGSRWEIAGRVAPGVDKLIIVRSDGERVTATIDDGWFLAWWPSHSEPVQFEVTNGNDVTTIDLGDRFDMGGPPCRIGLFNGLCLWSY
jgi:hypothetical protein